MLTHCAEIVAEASNQLFETMRITLGSLLAVSAFAFVSTLAAQDANGTPDAHFQRWPKPRPETIFRICSTFNATGRALAASEHHLVRRPRHNLGKVKVAPDAAVGAPGGRRTDRRGMPNP